MQSGNVVLSSKKSPAQVATACRKAIADRFGLDVELVVRTRAELAAVVKRNPLAKVATEPKRYQVTFLSAAPAAATLRRLEDLAAGGEQVVLDGRELYAWHPDGVGRSKLAAQLGGKSLGVTATSRNWTTVTKLLELAGD